MAARRNRGTAHGAARAKDTHLAGQYHRIRGRRDPGHAADAVDHSILVIVWHLLSTGEIYNDLGGDYFDKGRNSDARQRRLDGQLGAMGLTVTLEPAARPTTHPHPHPTRAQNPRDRF
ncbi:MAG: hypothetical protein V3W34_15450 [Phycisphaerae bacterium]